MSKKRVLLTALAIGIATAGVCSSAQTGPIEEVIVIAKRGDAFPATKHQQALMPDGEHHEARDPEPKNVGHMLPITEHQLLSLRHQRRLLGLPEAAIN